jgi:hypothetical protein
METFKVYVHAGDRKGNGIKKVGCGFVVDQ